MTLHLIPTRFKRRILLALASLLLSACTPQAPTPVTAIERYQKLRADGQTIGLLEGPWRCVMDRQTDLVWEVKQANEGPQFETSSYSWFDGKNGSAKGGSCGKDEIGMPFMAYHACDTADLIQHLNQQKLCGFADWRLPSSAELRTLLLKHQYPGENQAPFPVLPRIVFGPYWSADWRASQKADANGIAEVLSIHLGTGQEGWISAQRVAYAIAVRSDKARKISAHEPNFQTSNKNNH